MEYEKHIKRLVLGYLKNECKAAYKIFLKSYFRNESRHIATRVAGQTLEDILRVYSKIQDIVQGRLEETNYYKEYGTEVCSPIYLVEQLLYLLEQERPVTPTSTIRDRSPVASSAHETLLTEKDTNHITDVETTPEHSLPGNMLSHDEQFKSATPFRRFSPGFRTPYLQQLPSHEQHNISSAVSKKLLKNRDLPIKLAHSINTVYSSRKKDNVTDSSKPFGREYDETVVKSVLNRTEADPMFAELLDDLLGPIGSTIEKVIGPEVLASSSSTRTESPSPFRNASNVPGTTSFATVDLPEQFSQRNCNSIEQQPVELLEIPQTELPDQAQPINPLTEPIRHTESKVTTPQQCGHSEYTQNELALRPSVDVATSTASQSSTPQLIIVNQPLVIPQPLQILQSISSILQPNKDSNGSKLCDTLTAYDIMKAPVILNDGSNQNFWDDNDPPAATNSSRSNNAEITETTKSTPNESKLPQHEKTKPSSMTVCTPSPVLPISRKPTPKGSSHVRNLTFPSPIRRTNEKFEQNNSASSVLNKRQASKDLFKENVEKGNDQRNDKSVQEKKPLTVNKKHSGKSPKKKSKTPKKEKSVSKTPKKIKTKITSSIVPVKKSGALWDSDLRKLATAGEPLILCTGTKIPTPSRKSPSRKRSQKSTDSESLETDGKKLEDALKTPGNPPENAKHKTPSVKGKNWKEKVQKVKAERKALSQVEGDTNKGRLVVTADGKKVLSPSKLCNTASKRSMDVDGITQNNPKENFTILVSHARKNINELLVTPLKDEVVSPIVNITADAPSTTPFTPMLKANLQGITMGDNFSIDTPNFPITPGMSLMEHTTPSYCILHDTETNKATEAILLSEEKKSSVRKTDEEDAVVISPKVYGCTEILEEFNKIRVGKKNLDLLDNKTVRWEDNSDVEEKNSSGSYTDEEPNGTVIRNASFKKEEHGPRITRSSGKSMAILKSQLLDSSKNTSNASLDESIGGQTQERHDNIEPTPETIEKTSTDSKAGKYTSSSDSEISSNVTYDNRRSAEQDLQSDSKSRNSTKTPSKTSKQKLNKNCNPKLKQTPSSKKVLLDDVVHVQSGSSAKDNSNLKTQSTSPKTSIREAFLNVTQANNSSHLVSNFSVKNEMEEKRKRIIAIDKAMSAQSSKTPSRRKAASIISKLSSSSRKRKKASPVKLVKRISKRKSEKSSNESDSDSQDEFFKQSGSNLHRTNRQTRRSSERLKGKSVEVTDKMGSCEAKEKANTEAQKCEPNNANENDLPSPKGGDPIDTSSLLNQTIDKEEASYWDYCAIEQQPPEIVMAHDEKKPLKKCLKDYDFSLLNKVIQMGVPLEDGTEQPVQISATPFKILWEIPPTTKVKSISNSGGRSENCRSLNEAMRSLLESNSDSDQGVKPSDTSEQGLKKRKHRSDSCSSNSSAKKIKASLPSRCFDNTAIEILLDKLHGPSEKS